MHSPQLPPALVEEVMFSVTSVRPSVRLCVCVCGHEVKVTELPFFLSETNLSDVITVRCGEREVRQRWGVFMLNGVAM